jgi:hypothetical protein
MRRQDVNTEFLVVWGAVFILGAGFWIVVGIVAWHFLSKVW